MVFLRFFVTLITIICSFSVGLAHADNMGGDDHYLITTLRAAPGKWVTLKKLIIEQGKAGSVAENGRRIPYRIRHSQGAQWDFMLITPIDSPATYLGDAVQTRNADFNAQVATLVDFREEWLVRGPKHAELDKQYPNAGMFLVEMFRARAGMKEALIDSRHRENTVLDKIGIKPNFIFTGQFGADWDVMTIGFHTSLADYGAAGNDLPADKQDAIARAHGFDGMGDLAPQLRSLLVSHSDTIGSALP